MEKVAIGIPCFGTQEPTWWQQILRIVSYSSKNVDMRDIIVSSTMATDHNRNTIVDNFLKGSADWLFWIDADTTPPIGGLERLLATGEKMISGLYYAKYDPYMPIAYLRHNGVYRPVGGAGNQWERGEIITVDMAGMGCMLTHRSIFENIKENYILKQELGGGILAIHKDDFIEAADSPTPNKVVGDVFHKQLGEITVDNYNWPFFALEHGRTEDLWFCELVTRLGQEIKVDTSVECGHIRPQEFTGKEFRDLYGH